MPAALPVLPTVPRGCPAVTLAPTAMPAASESRWHDDELPLPREDVVAPVVAGEEVAAVARLLRVRRAGVVEGVEVVAAVVGAGDRVALEARGAGDRARGDRGLVGGVVGVVEGPGARGDEGGDDEDGGS